MIVFENLSRRQEQALTDLLACSSIFEAAQRSGVTEMTLHRWLKQEAFQTAYREARREIVHHAMTRVQQVAGEAVATLQQVMQDGEASAGARVSAAKAILEMAVKAVELEDLETRVASLEEALAAAYEAPGTPVNGAVPG
jgi:hypothetical protein